MASDVVPVRHWLAMKPSPFGDVYGVSVVAVAVAVVVVEIEAALPARILSH
jgi:hypothetical protein